jgi:hypothetical protein
MSHPDTAATALRLHPIFLHFDQQLPARALMGKPAESSSTSWSALFGFGCFSSSHADRSGDGPGKVASAGSRPPAPPAPLLSPDDLSLSLAGSDVLAFTVEELRVATRDFSMSNFVGEGGFGPVYKGRVDERVRPGLRQPQAVAVKLLDLEGSQGHKEWLVSKFLDHANNLIRVGFADLKENSQPLIHFLLNSFSLHFNFYCHFSPFII